MPFDERNAPWTFLFLIPLLLFNSFKGRKRKRKYHQQSGTLKCVQLDQHNSNDRPHAVAALHDRTNKVVRLWVGIVLTPPMYILHSLCGVRCASRTLRMPLFLFCRNCRWKFASLLSVTDTCCWVFLVLMNKWCKSALSVRSGMKERDKQIKALTAGAWRLKDQSALVSGFVNATDAAKLKQMSVDWENDGFNVIQWVSRQAGSFPPHAELIRFEVCH